MSVTPSEASAVVSAGRELTADTITADQIRELRRLMTSVRRRRSYERAIAKDCDDALERGTRACRESCAAAWNKLHGLDVPPAPGGSPAPHARKAGR